ncbi:LysM peptidoglycan-binding domain-containing protein [Chitinimonas sp. BJYL2]|uniref:LysM peptidoglycan-binding domain-containing protein n=1 Tax=Chitinimonas sp. BJYL2 TaxID=2976696 RepID=UPI0022B46AB3|nr:LysM peptidoglycan-binding domain-containing protein [Chitinimonas sp. BJYL2]
MRPSALRARLIASLLPAAIIALSLTNPVRADELRLQDNAPERYIVVKGDTLWDISGKFLKDPWKWPQIWNMNKDEIKDPHWIYPGDVIVLDTSSGSPRLRLLGNDKNDALRANAKLDPRVRITQFESQAAPAIPARAIEPFLSKPLIVDEKEFAAAPRIALGQSDHVSLTVGDRGYAVGVSGQPGDQWQVYHGGKELRDPVTKELLGYEVMYAGEAVTRQVADVSTISITSAAQEITVGDRLIPRPRREFINYIPRVPERDVQGQIISIYGGVQDAGSYTTVVINKGERDGLERGHVLLAFKAPRQIKKEKRSDEGRLTLPERNGQIFIYRVFPKVSYGLLLNNPEPVTVRDIVRKP